MPAVALSSSNNAVALHDRARILRSISRRESCCQVLAELQAGQALNNTRTPPMIRWALLAFLFLRHSECTLHIAKNQLLFLDQSSTLWAHLHHESCL